ncbi:RagB/SusD family nutrient uptake outer membrane protein [uncultured Algibacter sp.]|uniref:RagB/SusD family nutrient uptake outer membrane protein n=1 Tax=uncultured Algibacter sp. TaxID=298659 RepID=UPI0032171817
MKRYIFTCLAFFLLITESCESELELNNPNFITSDGFFSDLNASESVLTSVYAAMLNEFVIGVEYETLRTDLAYPGARGNIFGLYTEWHQQNVTENTGRLSRLWDAKYRVIWRANQVIEGLNSMSDDLKANDRWTEQMGQARLFRGLMHFYLHAVFNEGKIIIFDNVPKTEADFSKAVSSSDEVKAFFRADLEYAYQNLPAQFEQKSRVDAGFAATILGTSYLYDSDYDTAITFFRDVINNENGDYGYSLEQDLTKLFTNESDFNSESIFEINYADQFQLEDGSFDEDSFFNRLARFSGPPGRNLVARRPFGGQGVLLPSAWLTYEYSNEPMDTQDSRNYVDNDVTGNLKNISLRAAQSIAVVNDESSNYYGSTAPQVYAFARTRFSHYKKYTNHDIVVSEFDVAGTGFKSGRNVVVNRLSGVYLMYAECLVKTGNVADALVYVNDIRKRWGLQLLGVSDGSTHDFDGITYDETSLMDHLMYKEYPMELSFEGHANRFINLRRWGVAAQRYSDLSSETFSLTNYRYMRPNGSLANRRNSLLVKGNSGTSPFTEYTEAAAAWASGNAAYYPLPLSEVLYNPNVSN